MALVTDFVFVRFASCPCSFMRRGHATIIPWLKLKEIIYTRHKDDVFFELPDDLKNLETVTPEICDRLSPVISEVNKILYALAWMKAGKYRVPLKESELRAMADAGFNIYL